MDQKTRDELASKVREGNALIEAKRQREIFAAVEEERNRRPDYCCGVCPGIVGGGYDCTCRGNPRCPNYEGDD